MATELGLRERKKLQTRQRIVDAALELFTERGFEHVPVAEVAHRADVSEATVFNYFPTKEDLVYDGMEVFETALIEAVRQRPAGSSVVSAFRSFVVQPRGALRERDPAATERIAGVARIVAGSQSLQRREQQIVDRYTGALAQLVADEVGAEPTDVEPWVVANALMGVNRAMKTAVHRMALAGGGAQDADAVVEQGRRALDLLERGLAELSTAPAGGSGRQRGQHT